MGAVGQVACQSFLVREACVDVLGGGNGFLLFGLVWWVFIIFLYLLSISMPFNLVLTAVFGVAFLYSGSLCFFCIVEVPRYGWGWTGGLSRFPV